MPVLHNDAEHPFIDVVTTTDQPTIRIRAEGGGNPIEVVGADGISAPLSGGGGSQTLDQTLGLGNDAGGHEIIDLADPTSAQAAATRAYTDAAASAAQSAAEAASIAATALDPDGTMAADSDTRVPSQKAVVTYVAAHGGSGGSLSAILASSTDAGDHPITDLSSLALAGLTGATAATRFVGGTTSGAPASGTFDVGDFVVDQSGAFWVCTTAGSPGTWTEIGSGGGSTPSLSSVLGVGHDAGDIEITDAHEPTADTSLATRKTIKLMVGPSWTTPEFWGATGDGTTDDTAAFASMLANISSGTRIACAKNYKIVGSGGVGLNLTGLSKLEFVGIGGPCGYTDLGTTANGPAIWTPTASLTLIEFIPSSLNQFAPVFRNLAIGSTQTTGTILSTKNAMNGALEDCWVVGGNIGAALGQSGDSDNSQWEFKRVFWYAQETNAVVTAGNVNGCRVIGGCVFPKANASYVGFDLATSGSTAWLFDGVYFLGAASGGAQSSLSIAGAHNMIKGCHFEYSQSGLTDAVMIVLADPGSATYMGTVIEGNTFLGGVATGMQAFTIAANHQQAHIGLNGYKALATVPFTDSGQTTVYASGHEVPFSYSGALSTATGKARWQAKCAGVILGAVANVGTAPTGASIIADVKKNGTTIYGTNAGNKPTIAASSNATTSYVAPDTQKFVAGDYITVDIDQVGSSVAGSDLVVNVYLMYL